MATITNALTGATPADSGPLAMIEVKGGPRRYLIGRIAELIPAGGVVPTSGQLWPRGGSS